jgi:hypothetical protein
MASASLARATAISSNTTAAAQNLVPTYFSAGSASIGSGTLLLIAGIDWR